MVETYIVKAIEVLKETEKALLFHTERGDCWIPLSCIQSIDIYLGKKRPVRVKVIKTFKVKYNTDPNKVFLKKLQQSLNN